MVGRFGWVHGIAGRKTDRVGPDGDLVERQRRISLTFRQVVRTAKILSSIGEERYFAHYEDFFLSLALHDSAYKTVFQMKNSPCECEWAALCDTQNPASLVLPSRIGDSHSE